MFKNISQLENSYFDGLQRILPIFGRIIEFLWNNNTVEHRLYVFKGIIPKKRITGKKVQPKICYNTLI